MRDSQKSKLYRAEHELFDKFGEKKFETVPEIEEYLANAMQQKWWKKRYPLKERIVVKPGFGCVHARGGGSTITLPKWARREFVIWHEVAHCVAYAQKHNHVFAKTFLELVGHYINQDAKKALKAAYRKHRVRFHHKKQLSPEVLAKLRERGKLLAAARKEKLNGSKAISHQPALPADASSAC